MPSRRGRATILVIAVWAVAIISAQVASLRSTAGSLWGTDAWRFAAPHFLVLAIAIAAALTFLAARVRARALEEAPALPPFASRTARPVLLLLLLTLAAILFWWLRVRHVLLGDGIPLTATLATTDTLHPRAPLAEFLVRMAYRMMSPGLIAGGMTVAQAVITSVGAVSVAAGVLFVPAAIALAGELTRGIPGDRWGLTSVLATVLLCQGYVQLFFGYIELYPLPMVGTALYLSLGLRALADRRSLLLPLAALLVTVALDFKSLVLGPSALLLAGAALRDPTRRTAVARDLALVVGITVVMGIALTFGPTRYPVVIYLRDMFSSGRAEAAYLFSRPHLRDFLNEHLLLGPFGLLAFIPLLLVTLFSGTRWTTPLLFLVVAGGVVTGAAWATADLPLGYARDWDLFASLGLVVTTATAALVLSAVPAAVARMRLLLIVCAVSVLHTLPWIGLNTSEQRSLTRFASLPLGHGRTENTIAWWHATHHNYAEARRWLTRALALEPTNARALDLYGRIAFEEGDVRTALYAYLMAFTLRPDKADFRQQLAVAAQARGTAALPQLDSLLALDRNNGGLWYARSLLLRAAGHSVAADSARQHALALQPEFASVPDTMPAVRGH